MKAYRISARFIAQPAPTDWAEQLVARLGSRPRRLGSWVELGLFGALECLAVEAASPLSEQTKLVVSSQHGPATALHAACVQAREDLPLPLTFLQILPSHMLATLSAQLGWRGDARFITHVDPLRLLALAIAIADDGADGLLVGWVDVVGAPSSVWLRLQAVADPGGPWVAAHDFGLLLQQASYVRRTAAGPEVMISHTL